MLPLKARILKYFIELDETATVNDILRDLNNEYGGEKQFTKKRVEEYIYSFLGIQFLKKDKVEWDENGQLIIYCSITDYGKSRKRYIES